eukprot:CAMPEP_0170491536 /NCGR_PEP_ID=MMETSP0208-20121228/11107_1 /TAXON_ID=197538 /ORGANISM="Strombidium inclinatum, Strain S3" /LENGTH=34 /DNA_ID= /DNA_START= /DNA_END= /DNA_ORIENTATION=
MITKKKTRKCLKTDGKPFMGGEESLKVVWDTSGE